MSEELVRGSSPSRSLESALEGGLKTSLPSQRRSPSSPSQRTLPSPELFLPEKRQKLLEHLVEEQFPAIRETVAKLLEGGFFLLDPAELSFRVIRRVVLEADEYNPVQPYWDWMRTIAASTVHEILTGEGEEELAEETVNSEPDLQNEILRRHFNRLALEPRRALYLVAVIGHSIEDAARLVQVEPEELRVQAREGLKKILNGVQSEGKRGEADGCGK